MYVDEVAIIVDDGATKIVLSSGELGVKIGVRFLDEKTRVYVPGEVSEYCFDLDTLRKIVELTERLGLDV